MKSKLLLPLFALACTSALANNTPKPEHCPSVEAIRAVGVSKIKLSAQGDWVGVVHNQKYDTNQAWSFIIATNAKNEAEAIANTNKALESFTLFSGPTKDDFFDVWGCEYHSQFGNGYTITPSVSDPSFLKLTHQ